jgi:hypothetical protein
MIMPSPAQTSQETDSIGSARSFNWREPVLAWVISRVICVVALVAGSALFPIEKYYNVQNFNLAAGPK